MGCRRWKLLSGLAIGTTKWKKPELTFDMPAGFTEALRKNKGAKKTFEKLVPTYQKQYLGWIEVAKRPETREKRIKESIRLLAEGKILGLK